MDQVLTSSDLRLTYNLAGFIAHGINVLPLFWVLHMAFVSYLRFGAYCGILSSIYSGSLFYILSGSFWLCFHFIMTGFLAFYQAFALTFCLTFVGIYFAFMPAIYLTFCLACVVTLFLPSGLAHILKN